MQGQALRPTQFILTYGVGSLIEAPGGPRIILDFSKWGRVFGQGRTPSVNNFEIPESMVSSLLDNGRIFRIPTNIDFGAADNESVFQTGSFPNWALCIQHGYLYDLPPDDRTRCPECNTSGFHDVSRTEAIRFVKACPEGHMDDIDWRGMVHLTKNKNCNITAYHWRSEGGSLKDVTIECDCTAQATLRDVYRSTKLCTGRFPESGTSRSMHCDADAKVTLRGSSSLRIPEIISAITIPRFASRLHIMLDTPQMRVVFALKPEWTKKELLKTLQEMNEEDPTLIDPRAVDEISKNSDERIADTIREIKKFSKTKPKTIEEFRVQEFHDLTNAAEYGHPPDPTSEKVEFQVNKIDVRESASFGSHNLRVAPIARLRVVMAQKGYRRLGTDHHVNKLVQTYYFDGSQKWFPGVQQYGEGIFIDAGKSAITVDSSDWEEKYAAEPIIENLPQFVWWHSLSHRIISALSIDSGYSSAAIRESVYTVIDEKTRALSGGVLLYTTAPGGDGSLGGLISLVPDFETVLESAVRNLDFCSNDPLCSEVSVKTRGNNGAACYACMFLSETSCAHRNTYLDRNLLRSNL